MTKDLEHIHQSPRREEIKKQNALTWFGGPLTTWLYREGLYLVQQAAYHVSHLCICSHSFTTGSVFFFPPSIYSLHISFKANS